MIDSIASLCFHWTGITIISLTALYFYLTRTFNYWSSRNVKGPKPWPLFGTVIHLFSKPMHELQEDYIQKFGLIYGTYFGSKPVLHVSEPELIKNILMRDFQKFVNRRTMDFNDDIMNRVLTIVRDDEWKRIRSVLSPSFSSGKMRKMHNLIEDCVNGVDNVLMKTAETNKEIELKSLMGNYTMDVIGRCAFATKIDTHNDPKNPFIQYAAKSFNGMSWRLLLWFFFPKMIKWFNIKVSDPEVTGFFQNVIRTIINKRSTETLKHHDFLQLFIDAQKKKSIDEHDDDKSDLGNHYGDESGVKSHMKLSDIEITENDIIANSMLFIMAGYETTASTLAFLFYSLAVNPEHQESLYAEILKYESIGPIDYDAIARMPFLDSCVSETLRLYNPAVITEREASEDYPLGDTGIVIEKGMIVQFSIHAIHHNPDFYPSPHRFDPNRFMPENRDNLIAYTFLPFGMGPRNCVGMRFALMEAKTAIVRIVKKYKFMKTDKTQIPLKLMSTSNTGLLKADGITVGIEMRE